MLVVNSGRKSCRFKRRSIDTERKGNLKSIQLGSNKCSCPGRLEIIPAGDAVNVHNLSGKIEIAAHLALHGFKVDALQAHPTAGDKLFPETGPPVNFIDIITQETGQAVHSALAQFVPLLSGRQATLLEQVLP